MSDRGKITGICVTRPDRHGLLIRSIISFLHQSYRNKKLIVVCEDKDHAYDVLHELGVVDEVDVHWHTASVPEMYKFGLNRAFDGGAKFITFADDDDESHCDRYARQVDACSDNRPCFLSGALWHFYDSNELFAVDFEERHRDLWSRIVHTSWVATAGDVRRISSRYVAAFRHKNPSVGFGRELYDASIGASDEISRAVNEWWWMKVGVRGCNRRGYDAHRMAVLDKKRSQTARELRERRVWLDQLLAGYNWDGPIDVCGHDGMAYSYFSPLRRPACPPIGQRPGVEIVTEET